MSPFKKEAAKLLKALPPTHHRVGTLGNLSEEYLLNYYENQLRSIDLVVTDAAYQESEPATTLTAPLVFFDKDTGKML